MWIMDPTFLRINEITVNHLKTQVELTVDEMASFSNVYQKYISKLPSKFIRNFEAIQLKKIHSRVMLLTKLSKPPKDCTIVTTVVPLTHICHPLDD